LTNVVIFKQVQLTVRKTYHIHFIFIGNSTIINNKIKYVFLGKEHILKTPAFADSVSEGDMRWEKSK